MKKEIILRPENISKKLLERALSLGVSSVYVEPEKIPEELRDRFRVYSDRGGGDYLISDEIGGGDIVRVRVEKAGDIERAVAAAQAGAKGVLVETGNWKIIPLENLVAELQHTGARLLAHASEISEVEELLGVLERGVDGVIVDIGDEEELEEAVRTIRVPRRINLSEAEVIEVKDVGMGERVCVDTVSILSLGEGMLVGDTAHLFFLIHNESIGSEFTSPRPFRVNAGAVHCYILMPDGSTKYLSELGAGDRVLIVSDKGETRVTTIGRVKVERRPLRLVRARMDETEGTVIVQDAETIRFVKAGGEPISVTELKPGEKIVVHVPESAARHFGKAVREFIIER